MGLYFFSFIFKVLLASVTRIAFRFSEKKKNIKMGLVINCFINKFLRIINKNNLL